MNEPKPSEAAIGEDSSFPREFRIEGQYRRCCLYLIIGGWVCGAVAMYVRAMNGLPMEPGVLAFTFFILGLAPVLFWIYVASYRLRLDEWGLSRRRFCWWTLWPWESFTAGDISFFVRKAILAKSKGPVWNRWIALGLFKKPENEFLLETLRRVIPPENWHEGERLELPVNKVSEATLGLALVRKLRLDHEGCTLLWKKGEFIPWDNVALFRIAKTQQKDTNVFRVEIHARDRSPVTGHLNAVILNGKSVGSIARGEESWNLRLQEVVPHRCWQYFRATGELHSVEEGEFRIAELQTRLGVLKVFWGMAVFLLPLGAWNFVPGMIALWKNPFFPLGWKIVALVCGVLVMIQPSFVLCALAYSFGRRIRNSIVDAEREVELFLRHNQIDVPAVDLKSGDRSGRRLVAVNRVGC